MQRAYIALVTKEGVTRFIFSANLYQARIFPTHTEALECLVTAPSHLHFRDGRSVAVIDYNLEQIREGWVISCIGPFDFSEAQMVEGIPAA